MRAIILILYDNEFKNSMTYNNTNTKSGFDHGHDITFLKSKSRLEIETATLYSYTFFKDVQLLLKTNKKTVYYQPGFCSAAKVGLAFSSTCGIGHKNFLSDPGIAASP